MHAFAEPQHVWTFDDLLALPEDVDPRCYEIVDGSLVVSPATTMWHEIVCDNIRRALRDAGEDAGFVAVGPVAIDMHPTYRIPDLVVVPTAVVRTNVNPVPADRVALAVEVVSPGSRTTDRITKPAQYCAAGIPAYWRVEYEPEVSLTAYRLEGDCYVEVGTWGRGQTAHVAVPFPVEVRIDAIAPPAR